MKVACCTYYSPSYKAFADISLPNLSEYCARHGYYMWVENIENDKWEYVKHEMFKELFEKGFDLIWYRDIDSLVTNMTMPITDFIDDYYPFYLTKDFNELNGGSVIIKNNESGRLFNQTVLENRDMFQNEQNFYNSMPMLMMGADIMKLIPHPSINSYKYDLYRECKEYVGREDLGDWADGCFVLHTPGAPMDVRLNTLKNAKVVR